MGDYRTRYWASASLMAREQIGQELRERYPISKELPFDLRRLAKNLDTVEMLRGHLAKTERHVIEGERYITRQREIIAELERAGCGKSDTAAIARQLLQSMEYGQNVTLNERKLIFELLPLPN
jgi:hypothetical protein